MDSKETNIILKHYKEAQIAAWLGDEETAEEEYSKCTAEIFFFKGTKDPDQIKEFDYLLVQARTQPRKKAPHYEALIKKQPIPKYENVYMTRAFLPIGSNKAEYRARFYFDEDLRLAREVLERLSEEKNSQLTKRSLHWIELPESKDFTGSFVYNFLDGTVFGEITTLTYLVDADIPSLTEHISSLVKRKILLTD